MEWVEHYLSLGVGRIYLFDHGSSVPLLSHVVQYELDGVLEYHWLSQVSVSYSLSQVNFS